MFFYLYEIRNKVNDKVYVGVHKTKNIEDGYFGSGKALHLAIRKYGKDNFEKTILRFFNDEESMFLAESEIVDPDFVSLKNTYNLKSGGNGGWSYVHENKLNRGFAGKKHSPETKQKISDSISGREVSDITRQKISENNFSKRNPSAQKDHARKNASITNSLRSQETLDKISSTVSENWKKIENVKCPHCGLLGRGGTMKRWHFDNCKNKAPLDQLE